MPQQWTRFPCPQCGKIVQENWGKCYYCGADLKDEKEKLAAQRQAENPIEPVFPADHTQEQANPDPDLPIISDPIPPILPEPVLPISPLPAPVPPPGPVKTPKGHQAFVIMGVILGASLLVGLLFVGFIGLLGLFRAAQSSPPPTPTQAAAPVNTPAPALIPVQTIVPTMAPTTFSGETTAQGFLPPRSLTLSEINTFSGDIDFVKGINFISRSRSVQWVSGWCATTQEILDSNLQSISWKFFAGDQQFPDENFKQEYYRNGTWYCRRYFTILDSWQVGTYILRSEMVISKLINDGQDDYSPGSTYKDDYVYVLDDQTDSDPSAWPVVVQDGFDDNRMKWDIGQYNDDYSISTVSINQGKLSIILDQAKQDYIQANFPAITLSSDFSASVEVRLNNPISLANDCYGLVFRGGMDQANHYDFGVCENQVYYLSMLKDNSWTNLVNFLTSTAILPNQTNILTVTVRGNRITCAINGELVGDVVDSTLKGGLMGIFYQTATGDKAEYTFDNFTVRVPLSPGMQLIPTEKP